MQLLVATQLCECAGVCAPVLMVPVSLRVGLDADHGVALEWRVLVGIGVLGGMYTFQTAFVKLCVGVQLPVGTSAGQVWRGSRCAQRRSGGVGVGGQAPR